MSVIDLILMFGAILSAIAISATCAVGVIVWLAGGKLNKRNEH